VKVASSLTSGGVVSLTANITSSKTPGGTVTFTVDGNSNWFLTPSPVVGDAAQAQLTNLAPGVHTISAQYSGDSKTSSSQTQGALNVAVTGPVGVTVQGSTGGLIHQTAVSFDLQ
jgi:hypothetical protein